ncbi:unnamed protein product [Spodoptera exigua]|nr:unnamed protein product [Spodoptera exigua]
MGVRVEAGVGRRGAWRVRAAAPRPSRAERSESERPVSRAARRRAPSPPSAESATSRAPRATMRLACRAHSCCGAL